MMMRLFINATTIEHKIHVIIVVNDIIRYLNLGKVQSHKLKSCVSYS